MQRSILRSVVGFSQAAGRLARPALLAESRPKLAIFTFRRCLATNDWSNEALNEAVSQNKVVVFMKGTPDEPMCGFSRAVVKILEMHGVENFSAFNILEDEVLRKRIKEFSNWPTVPQVYMNGEFLGGCDIMIQMHQNGELIEELQKIGHISALSEDEKSDR